jgi:DNA-binding FrmR family transcriptional regulator
MKWSYTATVYFILFTFSAGIAPGQHQRHGETAQSPAVESVLPMPSSIRVEHEHLHHELSEALASGGKTAEAAKKVEAVLMPHFSEEEAYAMPPLGLLETVARGQQPTEAQAREAIRMTGKLRANYDRMIAEHREITAALQQLAAAAREEKKPQQAEFAGALMLHAQNEEQILYPAALVLGDYLKLKEPGAHR